MDNENYSLPEGEEIGTGECGEETVVKPMVLSLGEDHETSTVASGLSGSEIVYDSWNNNFGLTFKWNITQDTINATSTVNIDVYSYIGDQGQLGVSARTNNYLNIAGEQNAKSSGPVSKLYFGGAEEIYLFGGSKTISHNADGTLGDVTVSASWNVAAQIYNYISGTTSFKDYFTGSITISNIPSIDRFAVMTSATDFTDEENPSITLSNPGAFDMKAKIEVDGDYSFIVKDLPDKTVTSYTFDLSDAERAKLREACADANTLPVRLTIESINGGGTGINWSFLDRTMTVVNANPTFSAFSCIDTNSVVGDESYLVQGKSNIRVVIDSGMVAQKGSTGSHYVITVGDKASQTVGYSSETVTADFGTIDTAGEVNVVIAAYDSRGNSTTVQKSITINPYAAPTLISSARRIDGFTEPSELRCAGRASSLKVNGVEANSIVEVKFRIKKTSESSYSSYKTFDYSVDELSYLVEATELSLDKTSDWNIEFYVSDIYGATTYINTVSIENPIMTISENAVAFGAPASADLASKGYNVQVEGAINISEKSLLAGGGLNLNNGDLIGGGTLYLNSNSSSAKGVGFLKTGSTGNSPSDYNVLRVLDNKLYIDGSEFKSTIDPINNLTSTSTTEPLSANMGRELNDKIANLEIPDKYTLPTATSSTLGGVKIGSNITNSSGTISVPTATSSVLGVVKNGTNISNSSGTLSVATGTTSTLGVLKVGTNLSVSSGTISVATATTGTLGVMKAGTGLNVSSGTVSVNYLTIYPVGAIYESSSSTSPASLFGGTWASYGLGRVTVGSGTSDASYSAGATGGNSYVTLSSSQMPSHTHKQHYSTWMNISGVGKMPKSTSGYGYYYAQTQAADYYTNATGDGGSHTNLQPYIVVYRWRRTA